MPNLHVVVVLSDNTDPLVYGPYDTSREAARAVEASIRPELERKGVLDHHIREVIVIPMRGGAR